MRDDTRQWISKAEGDFHVAERELSVTDQPSYDAICFHAQQCSEKYLKAFLSEQGVPSMTFATAMTVRGLKVSTGRRT